jgi:hypothetical protein
MKDADSPKREVSPDSIAALKRHHSLKRAHTSSEINAALLRMANGTTIVLKPGFKWTKRALAAETEIHINTLIAKDNDGSYVYQTALNRLAVYCARRPGKREDPSVERISRLRAELAEVIRERDLLIGQLKGLEDRLLAERDKAVTAMRDAEAARMRLKDVGLLL